MTFVYSVRFKRCSPGGGAFGAAFLSSSASTDATNASYAARSGRRTPEGGIIPARIFPTTRSQTSL